MNSLRKELRSWRMITPKHLLSYLSLAQLPN
nr:MAG TPA: hypothetical protein [Bacteriophage sp.]